MTLESWLFVLTGGFIVVMIAMMVAVGMLKRECLSLGYPSSTIAPWFERYCIAREVQTDVVVSIEEARQRPRRPTR